jgi:hypothetical protein
MKNIIIALVMLAGLVVSSVSFAGECGPAGCLVAAPRKVVTFSKTVVRETVRLPRRAVTTCPNGVCRSRNVTVVR